MESRELVRTAVRLLDSKKAQDIVVLDVGKITPLGDYFVIASGTSTTQVKSLSEELDEKLGGLGVNPKRVEGEKTAVWILMDYADVIVHLFHGETRDFYCLERLWADAPRVDLEELLQD